MSEYVSKERVVRDGVLVAFKGEVMTEDEAKKRGIIEEEKPKRAASRKKEKKADEPAEAEKAE